MRDRNRYFLKEAVVILIASFMVLSALPAITGASNESNEGTITSDHAEFVAQNRPLKSDKKITTCLGRPIQTSNMGGVGADAWISYNDGYTENSLGLQTGGSITMAIELTDTELQNYRQYNLNELYVSVGADDLAPGDICNYEVWIETSLPAYADVYTGGVNIVATGTSTDAVWQIIDIPDTPIPDTGSVFIGINFINTVAGQYPCGIDESNTIPPRAGLVTYDGYGSWSDIGTIGFPGVWGLDVGVCEVTGPSNCLPDQCDFQLVSINNIGDGPINSLPKDINLTITNNGEVGISELKLLADVYEKECGPTTELCCDNIYNLCDWEVEAAADWSWSDDGDGDTFVLQGGADNRWATNDQAWRCTKGEDRSFGGDEDVYLGLDPSAVGYDTLTWHCDDTNEISGAACAEFSFQHWCEGEYGLIDGDLFPVDYGTIEYSLDNGGTWTELDITEFVAYDTGGEWEEVVLKFINTAVYNDTSYSDVCEDCDVEEGEIVIYEEYPATAKLQVKFVWQKDPCQQYEGWYIDDVCLKRTEMYTKKLVHQTHEIIELPPCVQEPEYMYYEFPLGWDPEPDTWYELDICGQVHDCPDCCEQIFDNNCKEIQFYVTDIHDMRCKDIKLENPPSSSIYGEGDSIQVNMTVENTGTFAENNVPVDLKVGKRVLDKRIDEDFETSPTGWQYLIFLGGDEINHFRWTNGDDTIDNIGPRSILPGSEAMICADTGFMYPTLPEGAAVGMSDGNVYDFSDAIDGKLKFYARWSLPYLEDCDGDGFIDSYWGVFVHPTEGPDSDFWYAYDSTVYMNYENEYQYMEMDLKAEQESFAYDGNVPPLEFAIAVFACANDGTTVPAANPIPWSGLMLDNIQLDVVSCEADMTVVDTQYTGSLAPGQEENIFLTLSDAEFCNWCLCGDINLDDDIDTTNDECCVTASVKETMDITDFNSLDLTEGQEDCLWHICTTRECLGSHCAWAGIEEANHAHYVNDMDDSFVSPPIDLAGSTPGAAVEFTTWFQFNDMGDFGEVYARLDSSSPWVKLTTGTTDGWATVLDKLTGDSGGFVTGAFYIPGALCSANTQIKFRMVSDSTGYSEGWYICDVTVYKDSLVQFTEVQFLNQAPDFGTSSVPYSNTYYNFEAFDDFNSPGVISKVVWYGIQPFLGDPNGWDWIVEFYPDDGSGKPDVTQPEGTISGTFGVTPGWTATDTGFDIFGFYDCWRYEVILSYQPTFSYGWIGEYESDGWGEHAWVPAVVPSGQDDHSWAYNFGSTWYEHFFDMSLEMYYLQPVITYGPQTYYEDFERENIAPWQCQETVAGDYWDTSTLCIDNYPSEGKGLNNAMYTELDLTDEELTYAEINFDMVWNIESGTHAYIEISPDWDGISPMETATWVKYYEIEGPSSGGPINTKDLVEDDRFVINQYLGNTIYVRFRFTTPGEGFPAIPGFWCIDNPQLIFKEEEIIFEDTEPPVTNLCYNSETGQISLVAVDYPIGKASGVKGTYYYIDSGDFEPYISPFTLPEGSHTVYYYSDDNNDNKETTKSQTFVIDTTKPTVTLTSPEEGWLYLFGSKIMSRILSETTLIIGGSVPVTADADDAGGSGINKVLFAYNGETSWVENEPYEDSYKGMNFGELTIEVKALDNVGLESDPAEMTINYYSLGLF